MLTRTKPLTRRPMKVKPRKAPRAGEMRYLQRVADLGCLVCRQPSTVHHVTSDGMKRLTRTHTRVVPLCPRHHMIQWGPRDSVEALGHAGFEATYGIDLLAAATVLWVQSQEIERD
ncbi:MAG TPA: hypothetical protein VF637_09110 [Sphingomicrobium sp.]